ncbi:MAG TPA: LPS assembly lipoprotein LptE [Pseudomonadales bacterium]|jgi:LPS-assembly lipoprotein|nr:hypothetical protein [Gammaproteobacteria bacterium]MDP6024875.1 LPS assembly lipoprotein LptE [Pseudomonadales bacterium]MDP6316445.1 LPS assembly lipoprotein LptE [Pseudomonadales bacterium]MDP7316452.1 LPS assembly lipoprotein LptE [Pseudomonadales bacterium]MDP7575636.1 LPS assembly lipoprotein LptE [Pseudomonadales bacterium]|tara:strand:+ start:544 stop:1038 length:495 start_codon:yes stop_codon:yes gene_type:complete
MRRFLGLLLLSALVGCGFHLRSTQGLEILAGNAHVSASNIYSPLTRELENMLVSQGVDLVPASSAEYTIRILTERTHRRPVATSGDISVAEYELMMTVSFQITDASGAVVLPTTTLVTERIYSFDTESFVGSSEEEEMLSEEMRTDIANRLLRRFASSLISQSS